MTWKTDRADHLVEGNLKRSYGALPNGTQPQDLHRLLERLRKLLSQPQDMHRKDKGPQCH